MSNCFEITHDREFLKHFWDYKKVCKLSQEMVAKLRSSEDPYGRYGYGRWLYALQPDGQESVKEAFGCFQYASENGVGDATHMLSLMAKNGDYYNESKGGIFEMSPILNIILNGKAITEGSWLAEFQRNKNKFWGYEMIPADKEAAMQEAREKIANDDAPYMWMEILGFYHELEGNTQEATKLYEECLENGYYEVLYSLAIIALTEGDNEKSEEYFRQGVENEVADCFVWGVYKINEWESLSETERQEIHDRLSLNLYKGVELGSDICAEMLAMAKLKGYWDFEIDQAEGIRIALKGVSYRNAGCADMLLDELLDKDLCKKLNFDDADLLMLLLTSVRLGNVDRISQMMMFTEEYSRMGYGDEIKYWAEKMQETETVEPAPEPKTEINPTVLVIQPSGFVDFVEADVKEMTYKEMAELIDAEGLDAVHFSNALTKVKNACGLDMNVAMYVDRNGIAKDLPDNPVGSMLYGHGYEIRGAVIITMEDSRYESQSFIYEEDVENVYEAIDDITGLLSRDFGQEDGKFDPWA